MNLIPVIREIQKKIQEIEQRQIAELAPYEDSLDALRAINTACEKCVGNGKLFEQEAHVSFYNEREPRTCPACVGTGKNHNVKVQW